MAAAPEEDAAAPCGSHAPAVQHLSQTHCWRSASFPLLLQELVWQAAVVAEPTVGAGAAAAAAAAVLVFASVVISGPAASAG